MENLKRKEILNKQLAELMEDYEAVSTQITRTLAGRERIRLEREAEDLAQQIDKLQEELAALSTAPARSAETVEEFPFTNRQDEINLLLSSYAPAYYIMDAPAGYGKTKLLCRLRERFSELNWTTVYVPIGFYDRLTSISQAIVDAMDIRSIFDRQPHLPPGIRLGSALNRYWQETGNKKQKGIVFLIDVDPTTPEKVVQSIQEELIPQVSKVLKTLSFFEQKHNPFRVMIAGRYLASTDATVPAYPARVMRLSTFTYEVVRDSARQYLDGFKHSVIDNLVAHLFYLTGGHPGCIAETLQLYRQTGMPPDTFMQHHAEQVWTHVVSDYTDDIYKPVREYGDVLDKLSMFRYMDYAVLQTFVKHYDLDMDAYALSDLLTGAYLLNWDGRFLTDDIIRRLLAIKLRHVNADAFAAYSERAQEIYKHNITNSMTLAPDRWAIEYLFHALHKHAHTINDEQARQTLAKNFFDQEVPQALNLLVEGRDIPIPREQWRAEKEAISRALKEDWEFQFTINYYLRNTHYSAAPYQKLQQEIARFFDI